MTEITADNQVLEIMLGIVIFVVLIGLFYDYGKRKTGINLHRTNKNK